MPTLQSRKTNLVIKLSVVQKRLVSLTASIAIFFSFFFAGCSKLTITDIGSDLLPAVDNINVFDTLLEINATQAFFDDTTIISKTDDHALGKISNDPMFGTTTANIYAQFKPSFFPYYFGNAKDTITAFDSVVLCLSVKDFWGDSMVPIQLEVLEVSPTTGGKWDSAYDARNIKDAPTTIGSPIGSKMVDVRTTGGWVIYPSKKDSLRNHIRIKLSSAFLNKITGFDSTKAGLTNLNGYYTDSIFRTLQNGLAIRATGSGNGLIYTNLTDSASRLEVHFKRKNGGPVDTTFSSFKMISANGTAILASRTANNIIRNRSGFPANSPAGNEIYLQTSPGSYADLRIPELTNFANRIINRAEIIIEQVPANIFYDSLFSVPDFLYIDINDTTSAGAKWKPLYFDLNPNVAYDPDFNNGNFFPTGGIDYFTHGGYARNKKGPLGSNIKFYNFTVTRYVQQIVTKKTINYPLRLSAPYSFNYPQYFNSNIPGGNRIAKGRIKVGRGDRNANYSMRMRIIYSKM